MRKCPECESSMKELKAKTLDGVEYSYFKCSKCGKEILDIKQLHNVAQKYRTLKKYNVKLSKWGLSLGLRIPKELVKKYSLKNEEEVTIIPEEDSIRIIPA